MEDYKKKYEEAFERAKNYHKGHTLDVNPQAAMEYVFPELKDSKDEKIRKELIKVFEEKVQHGFEWKDGIPNNAVIAWLEKQGERKQNVTDIISDLENYFATTTKEQQEKDWDEIKDWEEKHFNHYRHIEQKPSDKVEQKPYFYCKYGGTTPLCSDCKRNHNNSPFKTEEISTWYVPLKGPKYCMDYIVLPEKQVGPKFKVGDWCIDNEDGTVFQIMKVLDNTYRYKTNEGGEYSCTHYSLENDAHLWSIQDAKDGDVLYHKSPLTGIEYIVMSRGVNDNECTIDSYFRYNTKYGFDINIPSVLNTISNDITPATKEQRALLFSKMKEAGYEWDADKKELKKIEQKAIHIDYISGIREELLGIEDNIENINGLTESQWVAIRAAHRLLGEYTTKEQKPTWNEEDENWMQQIISDLEKCTVPGFPVYIGDIELEINWLKYIKERIKGE